MRVEDLAYIFSFISGRLVKLFILGAYIPSIVFYFEGKF
jgi:hypothetical protein